MANANWRQKTDLEDFGLKDPTCEVCDFNGARLQVHKMYTRDRGPTGLIGLHVVWSVTRPNHELHLWGGINCTEDKLTETLEKAKKRAEMFALCWVEGKKK